MACNIHTNHLSYLPAIVLWAATRQQHTSHSSFLSVDSHRRQWHYITMEKKHPLSACRTINSSPSRKGIGDPSLQQEVDSLERYEKGQQTSVICHVLGLLHRGVASHRKWSQITLLQFFKQGKKKAKKKRMWMWRMLMMQWMWLTRRKQKWKTSDWAWSWVY